MPWHPLTRRIFTVDPNLLTQVIVYEFTDKLRLAGTELENAEWKLLCKQLRNDGHAYIIKIKGGDLKELSDPQEWRTGARHLYEIVTQVLENKPNIYFRRNYNHGTPKEN